MFWSPVLHKIFELRSKPGHELIHALTNAFLRFEADSGGNGTLRLSRRLADKNFIVDGIEFTESLVQFTIALSAADSLAGILMNGKLGIVEFHRTLQGDRPVHGM